MESKLEKAQINFDEATGSAVVVLFGSKFHFHVGPASFAGMPEGDKKSKIARLVDEAKKVIGSCKESSIVGYGKNYFYEFHNGHFYLGDKFGKSQ